jgi:hypothetical protein
VPFTPFHMGPGLGVKAILGQRFSWMIFGLSQVAMDVEPLVRILRHDPEVHGFTHTYLGATLIGAVGCVLAGIAGALVMAATFGVLRWARGA